jgi:DNA modification methylase
MSENDKRYIEYMPLSDLVTRLHPKNPKDHNIGQIIESYKTHGFVVGGTIDERTGLFLCGHGRTEALHMMRKQGMDAPRDIDVNNGDWRIPTQRGYHSTSDAQALAYIVMDNKSTIDGGWDEPQLAKLLQEIDNSIEVAIESTGYDVDDLDELLRDLGMQEDAPEDPGAQIDRAAELQEKWQVKRGDVWKIGKHRVMCGDSTVAGDVELLMGGMKAQLMVTDPPYGVNYNPRWREEYDQFDRHSVALVVNDDNYLWLDAFNLFDGDVAYVWCASWLAHHVGGDIEYSGFNLRSLIIWNKQHFTFSRGHYHWKHEPCWYAVRKNKTAGWCGDRKQTTVWDIQNSNPMGGSDRSEKTTHSTEKPVECMARPIRNHDASIVYDPFLGSGTTIVACEQTGRVGYGMEISEAYCAVTLQRLQDMGLTPERVDTDGTL